MAEDRVALGTKLKEAREYLGLLQQEVADKVGLSRSAVSLIEAGQRKVETFELKALSQLYERPIGFFTGELAAPERPQSVEMLARQAEKLSDADREELLRFSEYLMQRAQIGKKDGDKT